MTADLESQAEELERAINGEVRQKRKGQEGAEKPSVRKKIRIGKKFLAHVDQAEPQSLKSTEKSGSDTEPEVEAAGQSAGLVRLAVGPHRLRMLQARDQQKRSA